MSLLPNRFQVADQLTPLGKLVEKEPATCLDDDVWLFENIAHSIQITEEDCRQIKGVAQEPGAPVAEAIAPPTPVATPPSPAAPPKFKVGDRVMVIDLYPNLRRHYGVCVVRGIEDSRVLITTADSGNDDMPAHDLELIPSDAPPKEGEWIEWKGGDLPAYDDGNDLLDVRLSDGSSYTNQFITRSNSKFSLWRSEDAPRIVAYRLVKPS